MDEAVKMIEEKNSKYRICPSLGQRSDPGTAISYPSVLNCCYHAKLVAAIDLGHQEEFCLSAGYPNCKEYAKQPDAALPDILHDSSESRPQKRSGNKKWLLGIVLVGLGMIVAWQFITRGEGFGQSSDDPTRSIEFTETRMELTSTFLSPTPTPTPAPTFVGTATSRSPLGLEIPFGIDPKFVIHQIKAGESLDLFAGRYGTTVAALLACNYRLPTPLLPGRVIVIPINLGDTQGLPAFEVYSVTQEIALQDLAILLSVDLNELKYYNAVDDDFIPIIGDWLIIPRAGSPTP